MPLSRRSTLLADLKVYLEKAHAEGRPAPTIEMVVFFIERLYRFLRYLVVVVFFLFVIVIVLEVQYQGRQSRVNDLTTTVDQLNTTVKDLKSSTADLNVQIRTALDPATAANQRSAATLRNALGELDAIQNKLCNGPCPTPPTTAPPSAPSSPQG